MTKREQFDGMGPFSPVHQPDEGYSEEPINPASQYDLSALLSDLRSPADVPAWLMRNAGALPVHIKTELTLSLLDGLPTSTISHIVERLHPRLYIDFIRYLPAEVCLKILGYLDPDSLASVLQTCRAWYELGIDRKLWEKLYYLEGWKSVQTEIDAWEVKVNEGLNDSIGHLHRIQNEDGQTKKVRLFRSNSEDHEMTDRLSSQGDGAPATMLGSPESSFGSRLPVPHLGYIDSELFGSGSKEGVIESFDSASSETKGKQRALVSNTDHALPPILPSDKPGHLRSTIFMWDANSSRYRIDWKYLYNMRRRLESNWDSGSYTAFQLPHPDYPEEGHKECIYTLHFDSDHVVSGSRDKTIRIWNIHTRRLMRPKLEGHRGSVLCLQFDADPEEDLLVSGSSDSNVLIWKFSTGELLQRITRAHRESVLNVRFDKRVLVTSSKDKSIVIFNRRPLHYGDVGYPQNEVVEASARRVKQYGYEPDLSLEMPVIAPFTMIGQLEGHTAAVNAIQIRGDSVVSVSGDRHIKMWNWPDQVCTRTIPAHDKGIACVEYDGRRIVSGSSDKEVCIFDAQTGLKVSQLKGHSHLVRTVQIGFGDLPYSEAEDEAAARAIDAEYLRAVGAGEIEDAGSTFRSWRQRRAANAGSTRPDELQSVGAKLPPGGGGGRRYGRIVSGSYDHTIIIWRREKDGSGAWKPAHFLRQEEAAAAAQRQASLATAQSGANSSDPRRQASHRPPPPQGPQSGVLAMQLASLAYRAAGSEATGRPQNPAVYRALIDQVVPQGPGALQQALAYYPGILAQRTHLEASIDHEPSPFVRSQLRHVVTNALLTTQEDENEVPGLPPVQGGSILPQVGSPATIQGQAGSQDSEDEGMHQEAGEAPVVPQPPATAPPALPSHPLAPMLSHAETAAGAPTQTPPPPPAQHAAGSRHPHINAPEFQQARVFKLQFDARKIVCCTQATIIVGFDFCNGDAELEEASRFFATVD